MTNDRRVLSALPTSCVTLRYVKLLYLSRVYL